MKNEKSDPTSAAADDPYHLERLAAAKKHALSMGGPEKVARQHQLGRLTARERIERLLDPQTFHEVGLLAHSDRKEDKDTTPTDGEITGFGEIDGRAVYVGADDTTIKAGSYGRIGQKKEHAGQDYAIKKGFPMINLGDAGGGRIPDIMGAPGMMSIVLPIDKPPRDRFVPYVATIMGDCFGGPTFYAAIADIVIQVKGTVMAVTGPSVLEAATGEQVAPQDLGGWELHARTTGQVDLFAEDDAHCLELVRKVLGYLPSNANHLPPSIKSEDPVNRRLEDIYRMLPASARQGYDMRRVVKTIVDEGSVLELKPLYDRSLTVALARLDGMVVGVLANNPMFNAGAMGWGACEKATAFITLCDSFHIPLIFLHDTPGFFVSRAAEEHKMPLRIMQFLDALHHASVPKLSVILRKSYGMAHCNMLGANMKADRLFAWPTADVSFMAPEVAVNVVYGRKLESAADPKAERQRLIDEMNEMNSPWEAAGLNLIDDIIDPADTRVELSRALRTAMGPDGAMGRSKRLLASWPTMY
ncbi:MAG: acetyl-CoA carboxylase carboxyltransferase component [Gammaproteobacteria bacterium]|jgi:acetyl-CoA carboxylase carboxyltransferase component